MNTRIFSQDQIDEVVNLLKDGQIVALPTETVYGLAANATNEQAIKKIFIAKNRPLDHPLIVHIDSADAITVWAEDISKNAYKLAAHFWPGPLTLILKKNGTVSTSITAGLDTIAIRVPNHPAIRAIIARLGTGLVAPSANAHKKTSPTKPEHVLKTLNGKIAGIVDGGTCNVGIESTIIDMTQKTPTILRPGAITAQMIEQVLQIPITVPVQHDHKVAGNMAVHYQPEKPLFLISRTELAILLNKKRNIAVLYYSDIEPCNTCITYYRMPQDKATYAQQLYALLHEVDSTKVDAIYVETPPSSAEWTDIHDRLRKASSK